MENRPTLTQFINEANPMAFIVEQAGGRAITGDKRILDLKPAGLHQRADVIPGSRNEIERIAVYHASPNKAAA